MNECLEAMIGDFDGEEVMHAGAWVPEEVRATSRLTARAAVGGRFITSDYEQIVDGKVTFSGHGVYGHDDIGYSMYWFDSMSPAFTTPAKGKLRDGVLVFENKSAQGHGRYTYKFRDDGYDFQIERSRDAETWEKFMTATFQRRAT